MVSSERLSRLSTPGLAAVLVSLAAFSMGGAIHTENVEESARRSVTVAGAYADAQAALGGRISG
jgi:shikimate kinase